MLGSVMERRREISVYNSIGLNPTHIFVFFVAEAVVFGLIGSVSGYLIGQALSQIIVHFQLLDVNLNYSSMAVMLVIFAAIATVVISTLYPAYIATQASVPSGQRRWKLPNPSGDDLHLEFPFSFTEEQLPGVCAFLHQFMDLNSEASSGQFLAQDAPFGAAGSWDPLFHIEDEGADALARYAGSGKTSLAVKSVNGEWTSIYLADPGVGPAILAEILRILEEPLFIAPGEANYFDPVYAGPGLLALHGAESGKRSVLLPDYCDVQDLFDPAVGWAQKDEFVLPLRTGETRVFSLKPMGQGPR